MRAICLECGYEKKTPSDKCAHCGLDPKEDDDILVKSVYLSQSRFIDPEDQQRYDAELNLLAGKLKSGGSIDFNEEELERLRELMLAVREVRWRHVLGYLFRFFLPAIILLVIVWGLIFLLRLN